MSTAVLATATFCHVPGVSCRDTGLRVVALAPNTNQVQVLGGGAALVWRALEDGDRLDDVVERLDDEYEITVPADQVEHCLRELIGAGLVDESS